MKTWILSTFDHNNSAPPGRRVGLSPVMSEYDIFGAQYGSHNETAAIGRPILAYSAGFVIALRITVSLTSLLSLFGASLIIGTFVAFKELRTKARQILVQLSVADLLGAIAHMLGVNINLPKFTDKIYEDYENGSQYFSSDEFCQIQGGVAVFSTVGSYFWTIAVAYYLLVIIVFESQRVGKILLFLSYPICWGFPAILVIVLGAKGYLGFRPSLDTSWCYLTDRRSVNVTHEDYRNKSPEIVGQIFVYLTYITLPIIYIWIRCHIRVKLKHVSKSFSISDKLQARTKTADLKLTFIPIIFLFLRVWGTVLGILYIYMNAGQRMKFSGSPMNAILILMSSICTSAQGITNSLLFCVFTKVIRTRLIRCLRVVVCCPCCRRRMVKEYLMQPSTSHGGTVGNSEFEDTTQYGQEDGLWKDGVKEGSPRRPSINSWSKFTGSLVVGLTGSEEHSSKSRLLTESLSGYKYNSLSLGKNTE